MRVVINTIVISVIIITRIIGMMNGSRVAVKVVASSLPSTKRCQSQAVLSPDKVEERAVVI